MRFNKWYFIVSLFVLLLISTILLWSYFNRIDGELNKSNIRIVEKQATTKIEENFSIRVDAIKLLTKQLEIMENIDSIRFVKNAAIYYNNYTGFQAINWINKYGVIKWVFPYRGNEKALGKDLHYHPDKKCRATFTNAEKTDSFCITPVIKLLQGGYGVVIYSPVMKDGKIIGYVNGVFNVSSFFNSILKEFSTLYSIKISRGKRTYFSNSKETGRDKYVNTKFTMGGDTFYFFIKAKNKGSYRNIRNLLILLLGVLFSFSITLFIWLLFKNIEEQRTTKNKIYGMYNELKQKQYEINTIIENNPDAIIRIDKDGEIFQVNEEFFRITGYDKNDKYPDNIFDYTDDINKNKLEEKINSLVLEKRTEKLFEIEIRRKDGDTAIAELSIIPIIENSECNYLWIFARDLTEFNKLKRRTEQQTKMEAIGKVTGRVAHDFNNVLTGIIGYSDMIINAGKADKIIIEYANNIKKAGLSAKNLIKDLLQFSREQKLNKEVFDLNELIIEYVNILKSSVKKDILIKLKLDNEQCIISADKSKIESVLLNLVTNAIDAIENEGIIQIKTGHRIVNDGSYVVLTVEDNGRGIPQNIVNRIFEPFFTTKEEGKGTGLGLSIVYGIVRQHNGDISVKSELNKGTEFEIVLPEAKMEPQNNLSISDRVEKGTGKLLLVDDDKKSLDVINNMLKALGYNVECADSPQKALDLYKKAPDEYDLVVADYMMPDLNGLEMLKMMQKINPAIKAVIISGYIDDTSFLDNNEFVILIKPFTMEELSQIVKRMLK